MEEGESLHVALARELTEECALEARRARGPDRDRRVDRAGRPATAKARRAHHLPRRRLGPEPRDRGVGRRRRPRPSARVARRAGRRSTCARRSTASWSAGGPATRSCTSASCGSGEPPGCPAYRPPVRPRRHARRRGAGRGRRFLATADVAAARHALDPAALARGARARARELWRAGPAYDYGEARIGMSSWEALWCRWEGEPPRCGSSGSGRRATAGRPGGSPRRPRRRRHRACPGARRAVRRRAPPAPRGVRRRAPRARRPAPHARAGARHQRSVVPPAREAGRERARGGRLRRRRHLGRPRRREARPAIFAHALERARRRPPTAAVMVGDSLERDVDGAQAAGIRGIWLNRDGARPAPRTATSSLGAHRAGALLRAPV